MHPISKKQSLPKRIILTLLSLSMCLWAISSLTVLYAEEVIQPDEEILYQEDFEDGDLAVSDPDLTNGLTWITSGTLTTGTVSSHDSKVIRLEAGAYILSEQEVVQPEYTVSFSIINWYNTSARVMVAYQDENNHYSFDPATGKVYRCLDGVEAELGTDNVRRLMVSPRLNPSVNRYKIYFCNNGSSVTVSVDRDGYANRKDYEFTYIDQDPAAVGRFTGGRIKLARTDQGTSRFWVNYDDILITKGKLQASLPRGPVQLFVSNSGDDSNEGTEARPLKTISKAIECSYPGDEIIVEDGSYEDPVKFVQSRIYGEEGNNLVIRSRNKHKASIKGIDFKYGDHIVLDGFEVNGETVSMNGSTGVEVINNYIHDAGIGVSTSGVNGRVAGNYIYKCSFGIIVSGKNMLVENNEIERLIYRKGDADYFRFFGEGHIIRGNYMHGTRPEETGPAHVDGFQTFDNNGEFARNIIIEGNFIEGFYHQGFMGSGSYYYHSYNITFRNNVFKDATAWGMCISQLKDVKVYNNLFIDMKIHGVGYRGTDTQPSTGEVRNNIFYNARNCYFGIDSSKYGSNNILFNSDPEQKYKQESFPNDIVNEDPLFTDIDNDDYSLHPNSPAVDNGADLGFAYDFAGSKRPFGMGFDIGPYEYQGSSQPVAYIRYSNIVNSNTGYEPFKVAFDGASSYVPEGRSIVSYEWDFGDGTTGTGDYVNHTFSAGKHTVKLTVTDNTGMKHTASQVFDVLPSKYPNLYLYLPFEGDCTDKSGKGMTVTGGDSAVLEDSIYGKSIRFNNSTNRAVSVAHSSYLDGMDELTIAFYAKKSTKTEAAAVIYKHTVYVVNLTDSGFSGYINNGAGQKNFSVKKVVDDTEWHHYAVTYDGEHIVTYIDGKECSRIECTGKVRRDSSRAVVIGRNPWGASFEGWMDEIRIYDRALSEDEIGQIMKGGMIAAPEPNDPKDPGTPTGPSTPEEPKDPGTPTGPSTPEEPKDPGTPTEPSTPDKPKDPGTSTGPSTPSQGGNTNPPQTPAVELPSTQVPLSPALPPASGSQQDADVDPELDDGLITKEYPEMVKQLELLFGSVDIGNNILNPTYGAMMKREDVFSFIPKCQNRLKQLAKLTFNDIAGSEWYAPYVPMAVYRRLITGFPDGSFRGRSQVTRAQFLTMLARFNNSEGAIKQKAKQDAESRAAIVKMIGESWYTDYITVARDSLIYPDQYTRETIVEPMTRGEVFYALANYLWRDDIREGGKYHTMAANNEEPVFSDTVKTITLPKGGDIDSKNSWYSGLMRAVQDPAAGVPMDFYPAIVCLKDNGILIGNNGESKWYEPVTRAEALALFERLAKVWGEEEDNT